MAKSERAQALNRGRGSVRAGARPASLAPKAAKVGSGARRRVHGEEPACYQGLQLAAVVEGGFLEGDTYARLP
jgi:hypothetical protein